MSDAASASRIAALEKRIEELEVRNRALIEALEAVGRGANASRHSALATAGAMVA